MTLPLQQAVRPATDGARPTALKPTSLNTATAVEMNTPNAFFKNPQHERTKLFLSQILH